MQDDPIVDPWNLIVTHHAMERYAERTGGDKMSRGKIAHILRNIATKGKEMVIKSEVAEIKQLLSHGCKKARYFNDGAFLVVIEDRVIVTTHLMEQDKWTEKSK